MCFDDQVSDQKKQVGSTEGMQTTVATSELMQHRIQLVPQHVDKMIKAIKNKDFATFAEITMQVDNLSSSTYFGFCNISMLHIIWLLTCMCAGGIMSGWMYLVRLRKVKRWTKAHQHNGLCL